MRFAALFHRRRQDEFHVQRQINDLGRTSSWPAFACAAIAACALIFSASAQNIAHGWTIGAATSEFRALVLASASAGASLLGPFCWLAVARGRGFGTRSIALVLAFGCLSYASLCSLGFTAGSRDKAVSEHTLAADAYADKRAVAAAARAELAQLATVKALTKAVLNRRRELTSLLATPSAGEAKPVQQDAQASAVGFYARAAGFKVDDAAIGVWLSLATTIFLELSAAWSLTVAAALRPVRIGASPAAVSAPEASVQAKPELPASKRQDKRDDDKKDDPPAPPRKSRGGRPRDVLAPEAVAKIRAKGGRMSGNIVEIGKVLGSKSKTSAHRLLGELRDMGLIELRTTPRGCSVALA